MATLRQLGGHQRPGTNKTTPARVQPVEGQESIPYDRKKITMSVATPHVPSNTSGWLLRAPEWARTIDMTPAGGDLGLDGCTVYASGVADPWTAVLERLDYQEDGKPVEQGPVGIRVEIGEDDIRNPEQARALAHTLLRAADLLEGILSAEVTDDVDEAE
jgi:hypothetical protein